MEYGNKVSGTKKKTQCLDSDIISTLPQNITENILTLMPIRCALRTSILSKKWRYSWRSMPKLDFTESMVTVPSDCGCKQSVKYKFVNAIFHVLLFHNGPTIVEFSCCIGELGMVSECDQMISYLSKGNNLKELVFMNHESFYQLPASFFSLQGLQHIELHNCGFEPPLTFDRFSCLRSIFFYDVKVSIQMLQRFLSKCPLLEHIILESSLNEEGMDFDARGSKFTFVDLLQCLPLLQTLQIAMYSLKYLTAGGMPHKLPISLAHFKYLYLDVCLMEQNEISSALCIIRSSPMLEQITIMMHDNEKLPVQQTPTNFLDPKNYSDLKLDHLEVFEIQMFCKLPLESEFVKLIMTKSPVLQTVRIELSENVSFYEEVKMLRDMVRLPFPRASPSAKLIIERPEAE